MATEVEADWLTPADPKWSTCLARMEHDVYHLPEYAEVMGGYEGATAAAVVLESGGDAMCVPVLVRPLPERLAAPSEWKDAVSPYGYASPILSTDEPSRIGVLVDQFVRTARSRGLISVFLRLHPLLAPGVDAWRRFGAVTTSPTVVIELAGRKLEAIRADARYNVRRDLRMLREAGFVARIDDWELYGEFTEMYRATMLRIGASSYYLFSDEYFDSLRDRLGAKLKLCTVHDPGGQLVAGGLFFAHPPFLQYHLAGSNPEFAKYGASKLMLDAMLAWAVPRGFRSFHLGGGLNGRKDGLFRFKKGFSRTEASFSTVRLIVAPDRYSDLVERQRVQSGTTDSGFFPEYRGPIADT